MCVARAYKLAVDTGGTFTDFCLVDSEGGVHVTKEPSTPDDPSRAVLLGLRRLVRETGIDPRAIDLFLHGTTVATNAVLERRGARLLLLTTKGFRDVVFIGRQNRPHLYDFRVLKPQPLLPRNLVLEVDERIGADGSVIKPLAAREIDSIVEQVRQSGATAVAVCLLHSYANPKHEIQLKKALEKVLPPLSVTISADILPEFREYERTSTTILNAMVRPQMEKYLGRLEQELASTGVRSQLYIMQSNGGVITAAQARKQSVRTILSGPAGGVLAGVYLARLTGWENLITADMGGTSMDICLIHRGEPRFTTEGAIGGYPLRLPMLDIHTIGAGGGSVAWVDAGGALRVGPRSAGAVPGPACYGLGGTEPTVTDANLVLGRLDPEAFAGGRKIQPALAAECLEEKIGRVLGLTLEETAEGIIRVVNASMVRAMRLISVERGYDPRDFTLVAFGGAGPLHAVALAREMGIPRVLVPPYPGVTSAWGMLAADVRHDYSLTFIGDVAAGLAAELNGQYAALIATGKADLSREGFAADQMVFEPLVDLRYRGQAYELTVPLPAQSLDEDALRTAVQRFHRLHRQSYGYCREDAPVEVVALRLVARGVLPRTKFAAPPPHADLPVPGARRVYLLGTWQEIPVYRRESLPAGFTLTGPLIITQQDTTTLVWPGDRLTVDRWGNLLIETREG
jgi:N-methylhydantoinase A